MSSLVLSHYLCAPCDVEGRDIAAEPTCWNCGGEVTVTARPTVSVRPGADAE
jgi:DNA-directed RNA polymerase subunit RPC12/RpoP